MDAIKKLNLKAFALLALVAVGILCAPSPARAQTATPEIEQFFTVDPNDKSAALLAQVFGPDVWETVNGEYSPDTMTATGVTNNSDQSGVLGAISMVLNLGCMLLTVIIILWGAISANLSGTLDGSDAGRRYNLLWTPLRSVYSFGMLLPVIGGYSLVQVIMLKLMLISIGIANAGYSIIVDRMFEGRVTAPVMRPAVNESVQGMLEIALCERMLTDETGQPRIQATPVEIGTVTRGSFENAVTFITHLGESTGDNEFSRTASRSYDGIPGMGFGQGACGSWSLTQANGGQFSADAAKVAADKLFDARLAATNDLKTAMDEVASQLIAHATPSTGTSLPSEVPGSSATPAMDDAFVKYRAARDAFRSRLLDASRVAAADMTRVDVQKAVDPSASGGYSSDSARLASQEIKDGGWLMTGAIYWNLHAISRTVLEVSKTLDPVIKRPDMVSISNKPNVDAQMIAAALASRSALTQRVRDDIAYKESSGQARAYLATQGQVEPSPDAIDQLFNMLLEIFPSLKDFDRIIIEQIMQEGDFVSNLINIGNYAWNTAWSLIGLAMAGDLIGGAISGFKEGAVGQAAIGLASFASGGISDAIIGGVSNAAAKVLGLCMVLAAPLLLLGFFFAFYLPMVPMILWTINIAGWIIQTVKTFIAGPVWAAAHSIPEGEGIAGQHARQGYMLILGILLRPILLVVGIIVGAVILQVVGWFMRYTLPLMFASFDTSGATGFFGFVAVILITMSLCLTLALKCFSLSYEIADEILEWIGGSARSLGDSEQAHRMQGLATGVAANQGANVLAGAGGGALKRIGGRRAKAIQTAEAAAASKRSDQRHSEVIGALKDRSTHGPG